MGLELSGTYCLAFFVDIESQRFPIAMQLELPLVFHGFGTFGTPFPSPSSHTWALHIVPNLYKPKAATTLNPIGRGFCVLIALGTLLAANTRLANKAISKP